MQKQDNYNEISFRNNLTSKRTQGHATLFGLKMHAWRCWEVSAAVQTGPIEIVRTHIFVVEDFGNGIHPFRVLVSKLCQNYFLGTETENNILPRAFWPILNHGTFEVWFNVWKKFKMALGLFKRNLSPVSNKKKDQTKQEKRQHKPNQHSPSGYRCIDPLPISIQVKF